MRKVLDKCLGRMEIFTQERSKMVPYMEKGFSSGQMELFMKEIGKMERKMEWESSSTSEKNGDMKVSSKMRKNMDQESTILKMEPFTLEDLRMTKVMDLEHTSQLMVKRSSTVVSGKITD